MEWNYGAYEGNAGEDAPQRPGWETSRLGVSGGESLRKSPLALIALLRAFARSGANVLVFLERHLLRAGCLPRAGSGSVGGVGRHLFLETATLSIWLSP